MFQIIHKLANKYLSLDYRTQIVLKNTILSAIMKLALMACSLYMVPLTINYLNPENYGIWMAMSSILYWIAFFDMGLGNGMRNYMSEAISMKKFAEARMYFSSSLVLLTCVALVIGIATIPFLTFMDFNHLFNVKTVSNHTLTVTLAIAIGFSLLQFVVKNIGMAYIALQKYAVNDFITFLGGLFSVIVIFIMTKTTEADLKLVVTTVVAIPPLLFILASIHLLIKYPFLKPQKKIVNTDFAQKIISKGIGFFFIQITSCLIIFGSSNIIISHYCGPTDVTIYNVAYKLFNLLIIAYTILISPLWNAYTDAFAKNDYGWIRRIFKKSLMAWGLVTLTGVMLLILSPFFFTKWVGNSVTIPFGISLCVFAYVSLFNLNNCATYLLNGLNKIRVQIISSVICSILFLLSVWMIKGKYGIYGISISMCIAYLSMSVLHFHQCRLLIHRKAKGIWNK